MIGNFYLGIRLAAHHNFNIEGIFIKKSKSEY